MSKQNLIIIVMDSLRKDYLQPYNNKINFTENISAFADDSVVYENAVASAPWTLPSHATFFTGMYPWEHGATQKNLDLDVDKKLLAERFRKNNYRTACFSTNAWLSTRFGLTSGFQVVENFESSGLSGKLSSIRRELDDWLSSPGLVRIKKAIVRGGNYFFHYWFGGSRTDRIIEKSKKFIQEDEKPFFLFMNLMDAHEPYFPPKEYRKKHDAEHPRNICQNPTDYYSGRTEPNFKEISKIYSASTDYMDDQIGRLFDFLKEKDYWEDTAIALVSDHGQMLGEDEHYGHQYSVAEELISVPMILKEGKTGRVSKQVELRELYNLLPSITGIDEGYQPGTEYALGRYEFPDLQRPRIPKNRWKDLYRRHKFCRNNRGKAVKTQTEDGENETFFENFEEEVSDDLQKKLKNKIKSISESDKGKDLKQKEEEIQKRLRDLGYG